MSRLTEAEVRRFYGLSSYGLIKEAGEGAPMPQEKSDEPSDNEQQGAPQYEPGLQPNPGDDMAEGGLVPPADANNPQGDDMGGESPMADMPANGGDNGFNPQGADVQPMTGGPNDTPQEDGVQTDDEVIDVEELTDSQEDTEKKVDRLSAKLEKILGVVDSFKDRIDQSNAKIDKVADDIKASIELHNPTPVQKMALRAKDGYPFNSSPDEYWKKKVSENPNYSTEEDGPEPEQYTITKADIDGINDFTDIAKSFDGLRLNSSIDL